MVEGPPWRTVSRPLAVLRSTSARTVESRMASLKSASRRSAPLRFASRRIAPLRFAPLRSATLRSAPLRFASLRSALLRFAPLRFACLRYTRLRSALLRFAPPRFALPRFGLMSRCCALHSFQAATPSFRIARCSSFAIVCHPSHRVNYRATLVESSWERKSYQLLQQFTTWRHLPAGPMANAELPHPG